MANAPKRERRPAKMSPRSFPKSVVILLAYTSVIYYASGPDEGKRFFHRQYFPGVIAPMPPDHCDPGALLVQAYFVLSHNQHCGVADSGVVVIICGQKITKCPPQRVSACINTS